MHANLGSCFQGSGGGSKVRIILIIIAILLADPAHALDGHPRIVDGDTLEIAGQHIRFHGIDAPERNQTCGDGWACGREATAYLASLIGDRPVSCEATDWDRYGRMVAICRAGELDLNAAMVAAGWAVAYRRYSLDYVSEEEAARAAGSGIWAGEFVAPADWRRGVPEP